VKRIIVLALAGAAALAIPTVADAKPGHSGPDACKRTKRVGFAAAGPLVALEETSLRIYVKRANRHARRWLAQREPLFESAGARLKLARLVDRDGSGTVELTDAAPGDRIRVSGKLTLPKRRCSGDAALVVRRVSVAAAPGVPDPVSEATRERGGHKKPAPTSTPTPAPPTGEVIWAADAERELALEWATGNAFDVNSGNATSTLNSAWALSSRVRRTTSPVAQGSYAYAMTVRGSDRDAYTSGAQRTELGQNNAARTMADGVDRQMRQGQERWIGFQVRIPASYPSAAWNTLVQLKGAGSGNGPLGVYWENNRVVLKKSSSQTYGSTSIASVWSPATATPRDSWIKLLVHVKWSTGGDGFYELLGDLADGQGLRQLKPLTSGWTLKYAADGTPVSVGPRVGIYRSALTQDATAYFDGFAVGATRADATLRAFGAAL
jgi:hypothetical protein